MQTMCLSEKLLQQGVKDKDEGMVAAPPMTKEYSKPLRVSSVRNCDPSLAAWIHRHATGMRFNLPTKCCQRVSLPRRYETSIKLPRNTRLRGTSWAVDTYCAWQTLSVSIAGIPFNFPVGISLWSVHILLFSCRAGQIASRSSPSVRPQEDTNTHLQLNNRAELGDQRGSGAPNSPEKQKPAHIFHVCLYRKWNLLNKLPPQGCRSTFSICKLDVNRRRFSGFKCTSRAFDKSVWEQSPELELILLCWIKTARLDSSRMQTECESYCWRGDCRESWCYYTSAVRCLAGALYTQ